MHKQKRSWIIDAVLYVAFLVSMLLDLTGLEAHQWLGVAVTLLATYHLLIHRQWVGAITRRFLRRLGGRSREMYLVDAGLLVGFLVIGVTGLAISTWLELPLGDYIVWRDVHVIASVATLGLVILKIGLHWRWILATAARGFRGVPASAQPNMTPCPVPPATFGRRQFLGLMGSVGVTALFASVHALDSVIAAPESEPVVASATPPVPSKAAPQTEAPGRRGRGYGEERARSRDSAVPLAPRTTSPQPQAAAGQGSSATSQCVVRCPKHCSYPGKCRRYVDTNGNRLCDLGECL